jgi:hypothetical protein
MTPLKLAIVIMGFETIRTAVAIAHHVWGG